MTDQRTQRVVDYAMSFIGVPYRFGGNTPDGGLDCSALSLIILQAFGAIDSVDRTALEIHRELLKRGGKLLSSGDIAFPTTFLFYGPSLSKITHVAMALDEWSLIEAGGGDRSCVTLEKAREMRAFVRIRPISHRKDLVAAVLPMWPWHVSKTK